jgi:hypothetical protein
MARTLTTVLRELPDRRRSRVDARYDELVQGISGLAELRALTGKAQIDIAEALSIKQPSVSRMERQTDMYLSTLGAYIRAAGGDLEIRITLPGGRKVSLKSIGQKAIDDAEAHEDGRSGAI